MRPIIHSRKHEVQIALSAALSGARNIEPIATAIEGAHTTPVTVSEGINIKAVYVEMWCVSAGTTIGSFTFILYKLPGAAADPSFADMGALHDWDNKKNILYTSQGLVPDNASFPMQICKQWFKIPKGKQRFGLNDKLALAIRNNITDDLNYCGLAIYKEYS